MRYFWKRGNIKKGSVEIEDWDYSLCLSVQFVLGFQENSIYTLHFCFGYDITKWCKGYTKTYSGFQKSHEEFGQLQTSSEKFKKLKFDGLLLSKKYIPSTKKLSTEDLSNITFNYFYENSPNFWNHKSFFKTQILCIFLAQTLHNFYKSSLSKCKFSDFPLLGLKFTKLLMSFLESRVSFSSNFAFLFSVMKHNSSVLFHFNLYMLGTKEAHQNANFQTFDCSPEN